MTGGTSGFGRRALEMILARPEWRVILLARRSERTEALKRTYADTGRLAIVEADLASLASISAAISEVETQLGGRAIDAMALNAGMQAVTGDQASAEIDRNFMLRLKGRERKLLKKIDQALEKIEGGTYGICEACGEEINIKRLKARPVTTMCIECKTEQEEEEKLREGS